MSSLPEESKDLQKIRQVLFPQSKRTSDWKLHKEFGMLLPNESLTKLLLQSLSARTDDDFAIRFIFEEKFFAPDVYVHQSRLQFAGGPLAALTQDGFREAEMRQVKLCASDTPKAFAVIKSFLHGLPFYLNGNMLELLIVAKSAHRWGLYVLVHWICMAVVERGLLKTENYKALCAWLEMIELHDVPKAFLHALFAAVGERYEDFCLKDGNRLYIVGDGTVSIKPSDEGKGVPVREKSCPLFPRLWEIAVGKNYARTVILNLPPRLNQALREEVLNVILLFLEPRVKEDEKVMVLFEELHVEKMSYYYSVMNSGVLDNVYSSRASRLLGLYMCARLEEKLKSVLNSPYNRNYYSNTRITRKTSYPWIEGLGEKLDGEEFDGEELDGEEPDPYDDDADYY